MRLVDYQRMTKEILLIYFMTLYSLLLYSRTFKGLIRTSKSHEMVRNISYRRLYFKFLIKYDKKLVNTFNYM